MLINDYCVKKVCAANQFRSKNRSCYGCDNYTSYEVIDSSYCEEQCNTTGQTADKLRETVVIGGKNMCQRKNCPTDYYREESSGVCKQCYSAGVSYYALTAAEVAQCATTAYPLFKGSDGKAYLCTESKGVATANETDCTTYCPSRSYADGICYKDACSGGFRSTDGTCYACDTTSTPTTTEAESDLCMSTANKRWWSYGYNGTSSSSYEISWSCDVDQTNYKATTDQCGHCTNRVLINDYCVLKATTGNLHASNSSIVSCSSLTPIKAHNNVEKQAEECATQCGESRKMYGNYCAVTYCNYEYVNNNGYFHRSSDGACFACSADDKVALSGNTEKEECLACGNREIFNGLCVKKCDAGSFHTNDGACALCDSTDKILTTPDAVKACGDKRCIDKDGYSTLC